MTLNREKVTAALKRIAEREGWPITTPDDDEYPPSCSDPAGHKFECTGTQYGGDDERWHGEGRCLCIHCGADGDA